MTIERNWRYFKVDPAKLMSGDADKTGLLYLLDGALADLKEKKGEFWTANVELFVCTKLFNTALAKQAAEVNARFIARYADAIVRDKYGEENALVKMREMIADANDIADSVLEGLVKLAQLAPSTETAQ